MVRIEKEYIDIYELECPFCHHVPDSDWDEDTVFCKHLVYFYDNCTDNNVLRADKEWIDKIKPVLIEYSDSIDIEEYIENTLDIDTEEIDKFDYHKYVKEYIDNYIEDGYLTVDNIENALLAAGRTEILDSLIVEVFSSDGYSGEVVEAIFDSKVSNVKV